MDRKAVEKCLSRFEEVSLYRFGELAFQQDAKKTPLFDLSSEASRYFVQDLAGLETIQKLGQRHPALAEAWHPASLLFFVDKIPEISDRIEECKIFRRDMQAADCQKITLDELETQFIKHFGLDDRPANQEHEKAAHILSGCRPDSAEGEIWGAVYQEVLENMSKGIIPSPTKCCNRMRQAADGVQRLYGQTAVCPDNENVIHEVWLQAIKTGVLYCLVMGENFLYSQRAVFPVLDGRS